MVAAEFRDPATGAPDAARTAAVIAHAREHGNLLLMNAGTYGTSVRWMPPLVVNEAEIDLALAAFAAALKATA
jgi:4-aminobutyrate aminotransferase-like enzyme